MLIYVNHLFDFVNFFVGFKKSFRWNMCKIHKYLVHDFFLGLPLAMLLGTRNKRVPRRAAAGIGFQRSGTAPGPLVSIKTPAVGKMTKKWLGKVLKITLSTQIHTNGPIVVYVCGKWSNSNGSFWSLRFVKDTHHQLSAQGSKARCCPGIRCPLRCTTWGRTSRWRRWRCQELIKQPMILIVELTKNTLWIRNKRHEANP